MSFSHLHVHTHYSLLDGLASPKELIKRTIELGMDSLAISDHGNMFGAIEFYTTCKEYGINPIIGIEVYVAPASCTEKKTKKGDIKYYHMTLLSYNYTGYKNLMQLATLGYTVGFYYKPRIDIHLLRKHKEGLFILSGCIQSLLSQLALADRPDLVHEFAMDFREIFGDKFYLESQNANIAGQDKINTVLNNLSKSIPVVATNDVHYVNKEDYKAHDALLCISTRKTIKETQRLRMESDQLYLKSEAEMLDMFPEAYVYMSGILARMCDLNIPFNNNTHIMKPDIAFNKLRQICDTKSLLNGIYQARYKEELEAIQKTGYAEYLLIVADFMHFARVCNIPVGSGRGSSASSLVCYLLGITEIDPIINGLIFERFINQDRIEPPDIDVDICQDRRHEIIEYLKNEYGEDKVAQIVTFGSMKIRQTIRDVCRVMDIPFMVGETINKLLPQHFEGTIDEVLEFSKIRNYIYKHIDVVEQFIYICRKVIGTLRHSSTHAAGVVISNIPLNNITPLCKKTNSDDVLIQYDMHSACKLGLLKFDILGLKTITVINNACILSAIDKNNIPLTDTYTFSMLRRGETYGIFQYAGWGYTQFIKQMQPRTFNDLVHLGALYRPGVLDSDMAQEYLDRMHGKPYECVDDFLDETYGIMLYQEQVMKTAVKYAGFTINEADILRKAISKKNKTLMDKMLSKIQDKELAKRIVTFARYGWNKAHAVSYALLSYQTAYLKFNHTTAFFCALLNSELSVIEKTRENMRRAAEYGVQIECPHINHSGTQFELRDGKIYAGLLSIKGIGQRACNVIIQERQKCGIYIDANNLRERISRQDLNSVAFHALISNNVFR